MLDETESAVAAWLDNAATQREIAIARRRLAQLNSTADPVLFALGIELLAALDIYGGDPVEAIPEGDEFPDEEDNEPWKR